MQLESIPRLDNVVQQRFHNIQKPSQKRQLVVLSNKCTRSFDFDTQTSQREVLTIRPENSRIS